MATAAPPGRTCPGTLDEMGRRETDDVIAALHIDLPVAPTTFRVASTDLDPWPKVSCVGIGHINATELRDTVLYHRRNLPGIGEIYNRVSATRVRVAFFNKIL